jgi:hypothetical protein
VATSNVGLSKTSCVSSRACTQNTQAVCPLEHVLRTHVGVMCRVDAGSFLRVSCLVFTESKNLNRGTSDVTHLSTQVSQSDQ